MGIAAKHAENAEDAEEENPDSEASIPSCSFLFHTAR